ncbi:MAG: HAMP domain-containing histidine kinase [Bacillota bacterium]|nr:HAMP domain-containing histidine kinase [Bacillota bacterium]
MVSKWMLNRENSIIQKTLEDITTYYKQNENQLDDKYFRENASLLKKLNDKNQLIRVYDHAGHIIALDKNGDFDTFEPVTVSIKTMDHIKSENNETLVARMPLVSKNFQGTIEIVRELTAYNKMMSQLFVVMMIFGLAAILLSAIFGYFLAKQFLWPVRELAMTMKKIKENGFQERMHIYTRKDELSELSNLFNEMMDEIENSFSQQKQFIEDASHELRTPISILEGHISLLNRWGKKDAAILDESIAAVLQEMTRLKKLVVDLLELTRAENSRLLMQGEKAEAQSLIQQTVRNFELIHPEFDFKLIINQSLDGLLIPEEHLQQILIILLDNSIKYSPNEKKITIEAEQSTDSVILTVKDAGIGIPHEHLTKVFNRFYRIDKARNRKNGGTGLGLSIAKRLVEKNKGTIWIESEEEKGTIVKIVFPINVN